LPLSVDLEHLECGRGTSRAHVAPLHPCHGRACVDVGELDYCNPFDPMDFSRDFDVYLEDNELPGRVLATKARCCQTEFQSRLGHFRSAELDGADSREP
jgi:hypothetical protein